MSGRNRSILPTDSHLTERHNKQNAEKILAPFIKSESLSNKQKQLLSYLNIMENSTNTEQILTDFEELARDAFVDVPILDNKNNKSINFYNTFDLLEKSSIKYIKTLRSINSDVITKLFEHKESDFIKNIIIKTLTMQPSKNSSSSSNHPRMINDVKFKSLIVMIEKIETISKELKNKYPRTKGRSNKNNFFIPLLEKFDDFF